MSTEEDLIRSTTRAIASTVRDVPPLRLDPAGDELGSRARGARRRPVRGTGRGGRQRWRGWAAPVTVAAAVVALAVALVIIRDLPNGGAVPSNQSTAAASAAGVPRYYVALRQLAGSINSPSQRNDLVVGDSRSGQTLATIEPPARVAFESVTAAADDRTFIVFAVTSSTGSFQGDKKASLTGSWYAVRLAPGTAHPARLTHLPVKPFTESDPVLGESVAGFLNSFETAVSGSGQEIAVPERISQQGALAVKVFSVATGRLLHEWTASASLRLTQEPSLAWLDGDRELALISRNTDVPIKSDYASETITVREWPAAGPATGDLVAVSKVAWQVHITKNPLTTVQNCVEPVVGGRIVISEDGKTFSCTTAGGWGTVDHLSFHTYPLAASTTANAPGTIDYQVTFQGKKLLRYDPEVLWASPSGDTLVGALFPLDNHNLTIGVISHGKLSPLPLPASLATSTLVQVAF